MVAMARVIDVDEKTSANLVLLGPPGVGKGTQAARLASRLGIPHISSGDLLRLIIGSGSALGMQLRPYVDRGEYVPDDLVLAVVGERLGAGDARRGFILDGFPRTLAQAQALDRWLAANLRELDLVLDISAPIDILARRMAQRRELEQRSDDNPEVFVNRLREYVERTRPVLDYYRERGKLVELEGSGSIEEVAAALDAAISTRALQRGKR